MQNAATRSPGAKPAPSGALRTTPATSLPGTNGSGGLTWYSPRVCSTSGKATPAARTSTTTPSPGVIGCEASGSGDVDELERRVGARQVRDLDGAHGRAARYRFAHHRVSTP